ncbi:hypothetical protein [Gemella morbillorum]
MFIDKKNKSSFTTEEEDWNNYRDEEILRDARYDETHKDEETFDVVD